MKPLDSWMKPQNGRPWYSWRTSANPISPRRAVGLSTSNAGDFLECAEDSFLMQVIDELTRGDTLLELLLTNKEELAEGIKVEGSPGYSDYEMLEFKTLREMGKTNKWSHNLTLQESRFLLLHRSSWQDPICN